MEHNHTDECLLDDIIDIGDDGEGYVAYRRPTCKITGEVWE